MFNLLSLVLKYIFIIIIYLFIFSIIRLIYLDIRGIDTIGVDDVAYLKLINRRDSLPYKINEHYVIGDELTLGRHGSNHVVIKDPFISKKHFRIIFDEGEYFLEDLNSANGTYLNGERIEDVVRLTSNSRIQIGNIEFLFVDRR